MGITKTDLDIRREDKARAMNAVLPYGIKVVAGGRKGPYTVIVDGLSEEEAIRLCKAITKELGWRMRSPEEIP